MLKVSDKDMNYQRRNQDPALQLFAVLARGNLTRILKVLKKDKELEAKDLFYLGFHFSEKLFEQKQLGVEVLKTLIKSCPRAKLTPKAKQKLKLVGPVATVKETAVFASA